MRIETKKRLKVLVVVIVMGFLGYIAYHLLCLVSQMLVEVELAPFDASLLFMCVAIVGLSLIGRTQSRSSRLSSSADIELGPLIETSVVAPVNQPCGGSHSVPLPLDPEPLCQPDAHQENTLRRRKTLTVYVGKVPVGSDHPLALQSMTTSSTDDVDATTNQIMKCGSNGLEIVRVTVQGLKEARACQQIAKLLSTRSLVPATVADIHFKPKIALAVAPYVDKVRINPGNFIDGIKSFDTITGRTAEHEAKAKAAIASRLHPLIDSLKSEGKCLRIGTNHGSLSERIVFQFGDSPEGMVASAIEFAEICIARNFTNLIFSMKSSNVKVMIKAYRLLVETLDSRDWKFPLHLGVTEAGGGLDGRVKSAVGIGSLLLDGIGDTIRVSLTEDPWLEAGPCKALRAVQELSLRQAPAFRYYGPLEDQSRETVKKLDFLHDSGSVIVNIEFGELCVEERDLFDRLGIDLETRSKSIDSIDGIVLTGRCSGDTLTIERVVTELAAIGIGVFHSPDDNPPCHVTNIIPMVFSPSLSDPHAVILTGEEPDEKIISAALNPATVCIFLKPEIPGAQFVSAGRRLNALLSTCESTMPVILWYDHMASPPSYVDRHEFDIALSSATLGSLLVDGIGNGILWARHSRSDAFTLLQACRLRNTKTEFISCPSCGRTLFDIQETTDRIRKKTGHLPGVTIAVMGCLVNGPGEMADADFGFVGSLPGKVDLYRGKKCLKRGVDYSEADNVLVALIKESGLWVEPS